MQDDANGTGMQIDNVDNVTDNANANAAKRFYPYIEQAGAIARRQLSDGNVDDDDDDDEENNAQGANQEGSSSSAFVNTLFVDFTHLLHHDAELAEAIDADHVRFEPYLRRATKSFLHGLHPELADPNYSASAANDAGENNANGPAPASSSSSGATAAVQSYFVAFHNLPTTLPLRHLRTDRIGRLTSISGTVTRTSDVRPELIVGNFRCNKCGLLAEGVRQQFHFTRPVVCRNPRCRNDAPNEFLLEMNQATSSASTTAEGASVSEFCDWQKLRVQENSSEIPPGSMPRSVDVIVRNEMVERAKAGDRCVFVGSLVVVPDGSALARAGEATRLGGGGGGGGGGPGRGPSDAATGGGGGVRGLKTLGVRELTYKTCFVATSVLTADAVARARTSPEGVAAFIYGDGTGAAADEKEQTAQEIAMEFTEEEREEIRRMKSSPQLYNQVSLAARWVVSMIILLWTGYLRAFSATFISEFLTCYPFDPSHNYNTVDGRLHLPSDIRSQRGQARHPSHASRRCAQNNDRGHPSPRRRQRVHHWGSLDGQVAISQVRAFLPPQSVGVHVGQGVQCGWSHGGRHS